MKKKKSFEKQTADQLFANNFENARKQLLALDGKKKIFPEDFFESMDFGISDKNEISEEFQKAKKGNVKGPDAVIKWICKEMSWDFDECKFDSWEDYWNFFLGLVFSYEYNENKLPSFDDEDEIDDLMLPSELISELEMVNRFMPEPFSEEEEKLKKMSQRDLLLKEIDERLEDVYKKYEDDDDEEEDDDEE